jgi:hypothetical protein
MAASETEQIRSSAKAELRTAEARTAKESVIAIDRGRASRYSLPDRKAPDNMEELEPRSERMTLVYLATVTEGQERRINRENPDQRDLSRAQTQAFNEPLRTAYSAIVEAHNKQKREPIEPQNKTERNISTTEVPPTEWKFKNMIATDGRRNPRDMSPIYEEILDAVSLDPANKRTVEQTRENAKNVLNTLYGKNGDTQFGDLIEQRVEQLFSRTPDGKKAPSLSVEAYKTGILTYLVKHPERFEDTVKMLQTIEKPDKEIVGNSGVLLVKSLPITNELNSCLQETVIKIAAENGRPGLTPPDFKDLTVVVHSTQRTENEFGAWDSRFTRFKGLVGRQKRNAEAESYNPDRVFREVAEVGAVDTYSVINLYREYAMASDKDIPVSIAQRAINNLQGYYAKFGDIKDLPQELETVKLLAETQKNLSRNGREIIEARNKSKPPEIGDYQAYIFEQISNAVPDEVKRRFRNELILLENGACTPVETTEVLEKLLLHCVVALPPSGEKSRENIATMQELLRYTNGYIQLIAIQSRFPPVKIDTEVARILSATQGVTSDERHNFLFNETVNAFDKRRPVAIMNEADIAWHMRRLNQNVAELYDLIHYPMTYARTLTEGKPNGEQIRAQLAPNLPRNSRTLVQEIIRSRDGKIITSTRRIIQPNDSLETIVLLTRNLIQREVVAAENNVIASVADPIREPLRATRATPVAAPIAGDVTPQAVTTTPEIRTDTVQTTADTVRAARVEVVDRRQRATVASFIDAINELPGNQKKLSAAEMEQFVAEVQELRTGGILRSIFTNDLGKTGKEILKSIAFTTVVPVALAVVPGMGAALAIYGGLSAAYSIQNAVKKYKDGASKKTLTAGAVAGIVSGATTGYLSVTNPPVAIVVGIASDVIFGRHAGTYELRGEKQAKAKIKEQVATYEEQLRVLLSVASKEVIKELVEKYEVTAPPKRMQKLRFWETYDPTKIRREDAVRQLLNVRNNFIKEGNTEKVAEFAELIDNTFNSNNASEGDKVQYKSFTEKNIEALRNAQKNATEAINQATLDGTAFISAYRGAKFVMNIAGRGIAIQEQNSDLFAAQNRLTEYQIPANNLQTQIESTTGLAYNDVRLDGMYRMNGQEFHSFVLEQSNGELLYQAYRVLPDGSYDLSQTFGTNPVGSESILNREDIFAAQTNASALWERIFSLPNERTLPTIANGLEGVLSRFR